MDIYGDALSILPLGAVDEEGKDLYTLIADALFRPPGENVLDPLRFSMPFGGCIHVNGQICYVKIELHVHCYSVNILLWKWGCFDGIKRLDTGH